MENKTKYWLVGAMFETDDMYPEFIDNKFWYMGWNTEDRNNPKVDEFFQKVKAISVGDRIAMKRLLGQGQSNIRIMAIGVVTKVVKGIVFVDWLLKDMDRHVPINGCVGTIYGPYYYNDDWTRQVFCI